MRFLFVKDRLAWPRSSGHDVHSYYIMQALSQLGHEVHLATLHPQDERAIAGADLVGAYTYGVDAIVKNLKPVTLSKWQEKFRDYWGVPIDRIQKIAAISREIEADVVSVVGLNVLPYLGGIENAKRIWYAGDEWVWHHLSQVSLWKRSTWAEMKQALVKGMYERSYRSLVDRVWMVSDADAKAWTKVTGEKNTDVMPNGVDTDHYHPMYVTKEPKSCVFWGRLDFGPNQQALEWFCDQVWPRIISANPDAIFRVYGFQPTHFVENLVARTPKTELIPDLPDLRSEIQRHQIAVMPFISGGGIKNKLLEAAAMGMPIIATPRTMIGLSAGPAVEIAHSRDEWISKIGTIWNDQSKAEELARTGREWVIQDHTWESAAKRALASLEVTQPFVSV
jgi:polysaccharide biosynthesis protein PslH